MGERWKDLTEQVQQLRDEVVELRAQLRAEITSPPATAPRPVTRPKS